jgi:tripartite-type tricarboxylate transporter receptor subunit TctC
MSHWLRAPKGALRRIHVPAALVAAAACWLALTAMPAAAQSGYPDRPIRLIVPFPPGGGADNLARAVIPRASQIIGQPIVIDNKPGAGGNVGSELVAHATPDGYTILHGTNGTHGINQFLYGRTGFDPIKDFAPVTRFTTIPAILVVYPGLPVHSVSDLLTYLRANPGKVSFASSGNGTTSHMAGELFKTMTKTDIIHVPYRGGGPALTALLSGEVQMDIDLMANLYPNVEAGKLRGLAVSTKTRVAAAPQIPTLDEAGVPGFEIAATDGIYAPAGTPRPIIDKLNAAITQALRDPEVAEHLRARGAEPSPSTPEELAQHIATELPMWQSLVKQSGAKLD